MKKSGERAIVKQTLAYVKEVLGKESSGHDWWHVYMVYKNALTLAKSENADIFVVSMAALLHDIADYKLHGGDTDIGPRVAGEWLIKHGVEEDRIEHICNIIRDLSFKGSGVDSPMTTIEGKIVQDADRLEAIGAVGIARAFAYGGHKGRPIYDPSVKPTAHHSFEQYKKNNSPSINHFYEKLLLLKDLMNTKAAKKIALRRHKFMVKFLDTFFDECGDKQPRLSNRRKK